MLEREGYALLDMRSSQAFNEEHIVKPEKFCTVNVPCTGYPGALFVDGVARAGLAKTSKILVLDHSGTINRAAADILAKAGYTNVKALEGGFEGWMARLTTSGRKQPPKGRYVHAKGETALSGEEEQARELSHEELWALDVDIDGV